MKRIALALLVSLTAVASHAQTETGAQQVISNQIDAFRSGAHDRAFSFATDGLQRMFGSTERFIGMVRQGYMPIYGAQSHTFERSRVDGARMLQEVRIVGPKGRSWMALYTMERQSDGSWRIAGVQVIQAPDRLT